MVQLLNRPWRSDLASLASSASASLLVAAPYIKYDEAAWLCGLLRPGVEVVALANLDAEAVSASALDLTALQLLAQASPGSRLIALPNLHAKVFVADNRAAIVTSGNLTRSGLESNLEYGVLLRQARLARAVREDMLALARLGSPVDAGTIADLLPLETELRQSRANVARSATTAARRRFDQAMREARPAFAEAWVGSRGKRDVLTETVQFVLAQGPLPTTAIHEQMSALLPDLCGDSEPLVINGRIYERASWKRDVRSAQNGLQRKGAIVRDEASGLWSLV